MNDPVATLFATPAYAINHEIILREKSANFVSTLVALGADVTVEYHNPKADVDASILHSATDIERRAENRQNESIIIKFKSPDGKGHLVRLYHGLHDHIVHATYTPKDGISDPKDHDDFMATWVPRTTPQNLPHGLHGLLRQIKAIHGW